MSYNGTLFWQRKEPRKLTCLS